MFSPLSTPLSDQIADAMADARDFSIESKIYYIDSMMILLMLLKRKDLLIPVNDQDREILIQRTSGHKWVLLDAAIEFNGNDNIPLTVEAEELIDGALRLQQQLHHSRHLIAEYVMLALLSVRGPARNQLEKAGLIFEDYKKALECEWERKVAIDTGSVAKKSERNAPLEKFTRFLSGKYQREKLADANLRQADYYYRYNQFRLVRNYCWYALEASPGYVHAYNLCAAAWMVEREFEKAYPHLKEGLLLAPDDKYTRQNLASCLHEMGEIEQADIIHQQLLADHSDDLNVLNNAGFFYADTGRYQDAITFLDQAIAIGDDEYNAFAYNNKGYALMQLGQLEAAREHILKSLTLHKGNSYAYRNLALLHLKENNQAAAKEALLQAKRFRFTAMYGPEVEELLAGME